MNVQKLIDELEKVEDKRQIVKIGYIEGEAEAEAGTMVYYPTVTKVDSESGVIVYLDATYE